ncbi:NADP-dependent phosphogluconate dehydrogenase [archaeon]|jgi:6-phosphogluconate dehydrogenase|nr:NADP-dependent phosphogluconate dehydrogenase [archaeon]
MKNKTLDSIGFIGLGKMGYNMAKLIKKKSEINVYGFDKDEKVRKSIKEFGAVSVNSLDEMVEQLGEDQLNFWMMLPSEHTSKTFNLLVRKIKNQGDQQFIIDGSNSNFKKTIKRHKKARKHGIGMLDVGVSGGILARETGYPMMIGGDKDIYEYAKPLFSSLANKESFGRVGEAGTGHYLKMVHNWIEYGIMEALGEGVNLLFNGHYKNRLDIVEGFRIFTNNTIIDGTLTNVTYNALLKDPNLESVKPYVEENGEGYWASLEALENEVPSVVNSYAVSSRRISRGKDDPKHKIIALMRKGFGGHDTKK